MKAREPLPPTVWRIYVQYLSKYMLLVTVLLLALVLAVFVPRQAKTYNCDIAEIHPDYPKEVKTQCRELRKQK